MVQRGQGAPARTFLVLDLHFSTRVALLSAALFESSGFGFSCREGVFGVDLCGLVVIFLQAQFCEQPLPDFRRQGDAFTVPLTQLDRFL